MLNMFNPAMLGWLIVGVILVVLLIVTLLILKVKHGKILSLSNELNASQIALEQNKELIIALKLENAKLQIKLESETRNLEQQRGELDRIQQQLTHEFSNLSNKIFSEAVMQNKLNLADILSPLTERIKDFERKVDNVYQVEGQDRASLKEQLKNLMSLNQVMASEAQNLTNALKTNYKAQGNWGEMVLENLLNLAGLTSGREYIVQDSQYSNEGRLFRPDVVVNLPDNRIFIIDSKVSLNAYERYHSATDEVIRTQALKDHLKAINAHIVSLSNKNYPKLYQNQTLDFVLMFMPIESAFTMAIQDNQEILNNAFKHNIILVSPTTLLATMRTVAHIWRTEKYIVSATEIANEGGRVLDKLNAFLEVMDSLDRALSVARNKYDEARGKLTNQQGVINVAKKLQLLGVKSQKHIAQAWQSEDE